MKLIVSSVLLASAMYAHGEESPAPRELSAHEIMEVVRARLPQEPLRIEGDLVVRRRHGITVRELRFDMQLHWGAKPATAHYVIRDAFGVALEQLTVRRAAGAEASLEYRAGEGPPSLPPLFVPIQGSDLSWTDLSLAFLWWPDARLVGNDKVRGRECFIIEVPAPAGRAANPDANAAAYSAVRLWVDQDLFMMLQAEGRGADGSPIRTLWVKSLKRTDDRWMIKDMEIQSHPAVHRTRLHIREITETPVPGAQQGRAISTTSPV